MKTTAQRTASQRALVRAALVDVPRLASKLISSDALDLSRAMERDAERLLLLAEYVNALANGQDHQGARKQASRKLTKIRRAMGYTYPESGLSSVTW